MIFTNHTLRLMGDFLATLDFFRIINNNLLLFFCNILQSCEVLKPFIMCLLVYDNIRRRLKLFLWPYLVIFSIIVFVVFIDYIIAPEFKL